MKECCYALVLTDGDSVWTRVVAKTTGTAGGEEWEERNLADLLREGWRPVRETPMGGGGNSYHCSLLVLEMA
jgi:hypothetical protein